MNLTTVLLEEWNADQSALSDNVHNRTERATYFQPKNIINKLKNSLDKTFVYENKNRSSSFELIKTVH